MKSIDSYELLYVLSSLSENIRIMVRIPIVIEYRCVLVRAIADFSAITEGCLSKYQQCDFNNVVTIDNSDIII